MNTATTTDNRTAVFVKMAVDAWHTQNARVEQLINSLTDEQLAKETAPGRNTGTYLLGHLIAVSDRLFDALGWGARLHPELDKPFLDSPDKTEIEKPSIAQLREYWTEVNNKINAHIAAMQPEDWFAKHTMVSDEDFAKEPHRNKLNVLMNRTSHTAGHKDQMIFLTEKK
jgi:hypothetical protein